LIEFEVRWKLIGIQIFRKTIQWRIIHFRYSKTHFVSHVSDSIWQICSGDDFTTYFSEWVLITNVKEASQSTNKANYIQRMLKHNDWCTCFD
jgi:hypothetical protein